MSGTSPTTRRTAAEMADLQGVILKVADEIREGATVTLRQLYYALTVRGVLAKTETAYKRFAQITSLMRREKAMPYAWIEDGTRVTYVPSTWVNARHALLNLAAQYTESPWTEAEIAPEIWIEKDALAGVIYDVTWDYCVPLRVQRGYASLSALYRAAKDINTRTAQGGVTPEQVKTWKLPTRPNKASDSRAAKFQHAASVELDAIPPPKLRQLVFDAINAHLPAMAKAMHEAEVESTRAYLRGLAEAAA